MPDKRERPRNIYADTFTAAFERHYGMPYSITTADMVQLDGITNKGPLAPRMTVAVFQRGVDHYFQSELGIHTLKHLCSAFVAFWRTPLDRFGKPPVKASQVGGQIMEQGPATWHPKFLSAAFKVVQADNRKMNAVEALMDQVADMTERDAFAALGEIENATADTKTNQG